MKMKGLVIVLVALFGSLVGYGQNQPPGTISQPSPATPDTNQSSQPSPTNLLSQSNLTFTNSAGAVFSVDQMAGQLQNLRQAVEQTLPMLTAFTQTYSNAATTGKGTLGGAISGILSDVLKRDTNAASSGQGSSQKTNLMAVLQQLLTTNAPASTPVNPGTFQDLIALQKRLQPIPSLLETLNVGGTTNQIAAPLPPAESSQDRPLPTGR